MTETIFTIAAYYILAIKTWFILRFIGHAENQCLLVLWDIKSCTSLYLKDCNIYSFGCFSLGDDSYIEGCMIRSGA